jgi:hypothetical protein
MKCVLATIVVTIFIAANAVAFDGNRKGFILGGGIGPAYWWNLGYARSHATGGVETELRIGVGITEHFLLYYSGKSYWSSGKWLMQPSMASNFYCISPLPDLYLTAGIGMSQKFALEEGSSPDNGAGFFAGFGYELIKHFALETFAFRTLTPQDSGSDWNAGILIQALAY